MDLNVLSTQNWSRHFSIWIEDIQVVCHPVVEAPSVIQLSLLRKVRTLSRYTALVVVALFSLHCTKPQATPVVPAAEKAAPAEARTEKEGAVYRESGSASWYGRADGFAGRRTASGEVFDPSAFTCAHRTLPFGTTLVVRNLDTGKETTVRVNDRGPFIKGRMLDVSEEAAKALGMIGAGKAKVTIRSVDIKGTDAPLDPALAKGNPFTIQVAALADPANITRLTAELQAVVGPVNLQETQTKDGVTIKRVRVGSYENMEQAVAAAEAISQRFKGRGLEPFITREY